MKFFFTIYVGMYLETTLCCLLLLASPLTRHVFVLSNSDMGQCLHIFHQRPLISGMQACSENFQSDARAKDLLKCESQDKPEIIFVLQNNRLADGAFFGIFYYGKQRPLVAKAFRELLPPNFSELCMFSVSLSILLTLPRLKVLSKDSFGHDIKI